MASSATPGSKRSDCSRSPAAARASALARARPSGSSSPRWATVCWMTLRPTRTERTRRQYRWTLPSFRSVVWRRYITQLIGHVAPRSQRPWLALHHGCSSRRSMATTDTHGATWRSRRALAQTAEVGLGRRTTAGHPPCTLVGLMQIWPGEPYPLGATHDGAETNFSLFSEVAERVELCLFGDDGRQTCVDLPEVDGFCWHGYLPQVRLGQRYGFPL